MTKRIFAVALSCIAAFSLAACGGKKDDTAKAKDVVAKFMTAIKNADVEGIKKNVDKKHADELKNNGTESQRERMKKFLSKSAAKKLVKKARNHTQSTKAKNVDMVTYK